MSHIAYYILSALLGFWACAGYFLLRLRAETRSRDQLISSWTATGFVIAALLGIANWFIRTEPLSKRALTLIIAFSIGAAFRFMIGVGASTTEKTQEMKDTDLEGVHTVGFDNLDKRIKEIGETLIRRAKDQAKQLNVSLTEEAKNIGTSCGLLKKTHYPAHFVDIALHLLGYPPELASEIAIAINEEFRPQLGYNTLGVSMVALGQIESLYDGAFVRKELFNKNSALIEVTLSKSKRIQKAGELLAISILTSSGNMTVGRAREIYHSNVFDPSIKAILDSELARYDAEIAREIIK